MSDYESDEISDIEEATEIEEQEDSENSENSNLSDESENSDNSDNLDESFEEKLENEISDLVEYYNETPEILNDRAHKNLVKEIKTDKIHKIEYIIKDDDKKTSDYIQLHEMTEAIGIRASQIEHGSPVLFDYQKYSVSGDPITLAKLEFYERKSPLVLKRVVYENANEAYVELWKVRDMKFNESDVSFKEIIQIVGKSENYSLLGNSETSDLPELEDIF